MIDISALDPGIQAWLAANAEIIQSIPEPVDPLDLAARRARERQISDRLATMFGPAIDERATITPVEIGGRFAHRIRPRDVSTPLPTQLFLHGGGFVSGTAKELINDAILSERAVRAGIQIISLDYRLAPEHPYPTAVEDTIAVLSEIAADAAAWEADADRLGVGGGSAGGHIAAVTALRLRDLARIDAAAPQLIHALLEVPVLSMSAEDPSMTEFSTPEQLHGALAIVETYRGPGPADEYFDPATVDDLTGLPRTLVMTAELDPLRDGAERYAQRLIEAGVDATLRRAEGQLHGTQGLVRTVPSSQQWQEAAIDELRRGFRTGELPVT